MNKPPYKFVSRPSDPGCIEKNSTTKSQANKTNERKWIKQQNEVDFLRKLEVYLLD